VNGLLLNADMSEAICLGTSTQLRSPSTAVDSVRRFVWRIFMQSASNALKSLKLRPRYGDFSFFQNGGRRHVGFFEIANF